MKVAVVYNRESRSVINLFGAPNQEKIGLRTIKRIVDALRAGGHQAASIEGDKDLIDRLEEFMPKVVKGERPGMVFNVSYGIQGQARYTHVPSILEMVGIPYVGSGPVAHSLALDKVVSKMIFRQHGLPTPDFAVLDSLDAPAPDLPFPLVVKPKNEAVSFGLRIVRDEDELREGARAIFDRFKQPVLVERYVEGREVNVGLLGNGPPEALPPVLLDFGDGGPLIYTYEDKTRRSGREIRPVCPAPIGEEATRRVQDVARRAFSALGCCDCARVDLRLDARGNPYILEINSLPSLGEHGSYVEAAARAGLDFGGLVNRLVETASARYFGTPAAPPRTVKASRPQDLIFRFLTERRDQIERRVRELVAISSRTEDAVGVREIARDLDRRMRRMALQPVRDLTDDRVVWTWETVAGFDGGTLFVAQLDVPMPLDAPSLGFRRGPEWLQGEAIGVSRAPLAMLEFALRALRHQRRLRQCKVGLLCYADEGRDCEYSEPRVRAAAARAKRVLVLRPSNPGGLVITRRRGLRRYRLIVAGSSDRLGQSAQKPEVLRWTWRRLEEMAALSSRKERVAVSVAEVHTTSFPMRLPHRVTATVLLGYPDARAADRVEGEMRRLLRKDGYQLELERVADRPPMKERRRGRALARELGEVAARWDIPFGDDSSLWPSVAGLVPAAVPVLCGVGPVARDLYTPQETVQRINLVQRTLLVAQFLVREIGC